MRLILVAAILLALGGEGLAWYGFGRGKTRQRQRLGLEDPKIGKHCKYCEERWFTQLLDHYNPTNTKTWKQRYFLNDQFYKENGPIFLMVSGEQVAHPAWLNERASLEVYLAKKFGAKVFFLEHRYYGMSRPTSDLSMENMLYLNADQALADTAYFIRGVRKAHGVPRSARWVLFGASYAGSLVAWMRFKYPHLVRGAVANSAPLLAEVDFKDFYLVVENAIAKHSPACVETFTDAFKEVRARTSNNVSQRQLEQLFNVCGEHFEEGSTPANDVINFYEGIVDIATEVVFNNDSYYLTIERACKVLEDGARGEPIERLAAVNDLLLKEKELECLDLEKYNDTIGSLNNIAWDDSDQWDRRWIYQTCSEFGWYQTTTARPFGIPSDTIPVDMYKQLCTDVFGSRFEHMLDIGVERTNLMYGGLDIANVASNIIFVHGSNDPWHAAGVTNSSNPKSPVLYVEGGGHCPLIYPPNKSDSPQKAKAKKEIEKYVDLWLQEE